MEADEGDAGDDASAAERPSTRDGFLQRLERQPGLTALVALASFAALFVGVLAAVPDWRDMLTGGEKSAAVQPLRPGPSSTYSADTSTVSALDLVVRDPVPLPDPASPDAAPGPDATLGPPTVEITVHNRGARRTVITRVAVTVEDTAVISQCASQGNTVAVSASYDVVLPPRPSVGDVFRVPVSQQQEADEADRFALRFGTSERATRTAVHLYRLRFDLEADGSKTRIPAGTAVVTVPDSISDGDGYFWNDDHESGRLDLSRVATEETVACLKGNSTTLKRILGTDAELSPDLAEAKPHLR
ncbi:hypothetical protein [Pseudosporangium ferrugineum]|nr:hypothetical protein [Pseudosporangium ferrugineum]